MFSALITWSQEMWFFMSLCSAQSSTNITDSAQAGRKESPSVSYPSGNLLHILTFQDENLMLWGSEAKGLFHAVRDCEYLWPVVTKEQSKNSCSTVRGAALLVLTTGSCRLHEKCINGHGKCSWMLNLMIRVFIWLYTQFSDEGQAAGEWGTGCNPSSRDCLKIVDWIIIEVKLLSWLLIPMNCRATMILIGLERKVAYIFLNMSCREGENWERCTAEEPAVFYVV